MWRCRRHSCVERQRARTCRFCVGSGSVASGTAERVELSQIEIGEGAGRFGAELRMAVAEAEKQIVAESAGTDAQADRHASGRRKVEVRGAKIGAEGQIAGFRAAEVRQDG